MNKNKEEKQCIATVSYEKSLLNIFFMTGRGPLLAAVAIVWVDSNSTVKTRAALSLTGRSPTRVLASE